LNSEDLRKERVADGHVDAGHDQKQKTDRSADSVNAEGQQKVRAAMKLGRERSEARLPALQGLEGHRVEPRRKAGKEYEKSQVKKDVNEDTEPMKGHDGHLEAHPGQEQDQHREDENAGVSSKDFPADPEVRRHGRIAHRHEILDFELTVDCASGFFAVELFDETNSFRNEL
jgi:hypothetical protein